MVFLVGTTMIWWGLSLCISHRGRAREFDGLVAIWGRVDGRAKGAVAFDSEVVACLGVRVCRDWAGWPLAWSRSDLAFW